MERHLSPSWKLSTDHTASSYGIPVLVHCTDGKAHGPADLIKPYPSYGLRTAADLVRRLSKTVRLDAEARDLVEKFLQEGGATEQLADRYFTDLNRDGRADNEENLRAWLWFTCPAGLRTEVEAATRRLRTKPNRKGESL